MKATKTLILAGLAVALLPGASIAQTANGGYLGDSRNQVVRSGWNLCWRTSQWTPALAIPECDAVPVKKAEALPVKLASITPPPVPAPVAAPPAPLPVPTKVSFSADALFAFDRAELKPEGKVMLDEFARNVSGTNYDTIVDTGHADRFGTMQYNQRLSERRANSVKEYLASKGIPANRIAAEGRGETQPVTRAGDCKGEKSAKVIACLQPDRRVDVEMTGTR
jgi:OOP family OmpA-OmpF porin